MLSRTQQMPVGQLRGVHLEHHLEHPLEHHPRPAHSLPASPQSPVLSFLGLLQEPQDERSGGSPTESD